MPTHATRLRFSESVTFTVGHAVEAMGWTDVEWPVAHAAAIAWHATRAGDPAPALSLVPDLYAATGIVPLDPRR